MKKAGFAALFALALVACEEEIEQPTNDLTDCEEFTIDFETHQCGSYTFTSNEESYLWTVNGDTLRLNADAVDFETTTNGTYLVEASYEGEGCPNGVTQEFELVVDCFTDTLDTDTMPSDTTTTGYIFDCDSMTADYETHSCGTYTLVSNVEAYWKINDEVFHQGAMAVDFDPEENGTYIVEAHYENENCPMGVVREFTITVDCEDPNAVDCEEFWIDYETHQCGSYTFISNFDADWTVDGEDYGQRSNAMDFDVQENGTYIIEAHYESENCPEGVWREFSIVVDCFEEETNDCNDFWIDYETHDCGSYTLISNKDIQWMINGEYQQYITSAMDFEPSENGTYIIEAFYESEDCPNGVGRTFNIIVDCE